MSGRSITCLSAFAFGLTLVVSDARAATNSTATSGATSNTSGSTSSSSQPSSGSNNKPPPEPAPPLPPVTQAPLLNPNIVVPNPRDFPSSNTTVGSGVKSVLIDSLRLKTPDSPGAVPLAGRSKLVFIYKKVGYRSSRTSSQTVTSPPAESEQTLTFRTQIDEAGNDVAQVQHDYQNDLNLLNYQKWLFGQIQQLRAVGSSSQQEYDENLAILKDLEERPNETQGRLREFNAEEKINSMKLSKARGEEFKVVNLARAYLELWQARIDKYQAIMNQAQIDRDYFALQLSKAKQLIKSHSISDFELVIAQRDADLYVTTFNAAQKILSMNQLHADEFKKLIDDLQNGN